MAKAMQARARPIPDDDDDDCYCYCYCYNRDNAGIIAHQEHSWRWQHGSFAVAPPREIFRIEQ